jgi:Protein of unknown function (DUF3732)
MNSYIKAILLFSKSGEKRVVELGKGLNIVTGQSKSGKSALLEIIDYCFGSNNSTIPKGKITDFADLYSIIFRVNNIDIVIGRRSFNLDGRSKMFLKLENKGVDVQELSLNYYSEKYFIQKNRANREIEKVLGLTVTDTSSNNELKKEGRPSIRNMMSYLLQHQNLIASKFALFYRFDDTRKREKVISQFPVFAGWVDQKYYSYKLSLNILQRELRSREKEHINYKKYLEQKKNSLFSTFDKYYTLIGEKLDRTFTIEQLLELKNQLPNYERNGFLNNEINEKHIELRRNLERLRREKQKYELKILNLQSSEKYGNDYVENLKKLEGKSDASRPIKKEYICPICGSTHAKVNAEIDNVSKSIDWINKEIEGVQHHKYSYVEEISSNKKEIKKIELSIREIQSEIKDLEETQKEIQRGKELSEQVIYAKAMIDLEVDLIKNSFTSLNEDEIEELNEEIKKLNSKIEGYALDNYYNQAKYTINHHMNRIVNKLDFEDEFKPADLAFDLEDTFDLYHNDKRNRTRIYLSEMGSGANWLSCHIGLFMSLLRYQCEQERSTIPKFLFFDQPSQVYFPDTSSQLIDNDQYSNKDVIAVRKIYQTILEEIDEIDLSTGIRPQVIVTDHVTNLQLKGYEFTNYISAEWFDEKLI